jgi:hypothetical protein
MTRRKERQARRNLALAAGRTKEAEERVTRVGFAAVSRVVAARREVELCARSEALDQHGTIFDYAASKDAFTRWMGNVREMHERVAVGRRVGVRCEDETPRIFVTIRISRGAEPTWEKVLDGTLRGASIDAAQREVDVDGTLVMRPGHFPVQSVVSLAVQLPSGVSQNLDLSLAQITGEGAADRGAASLYRRGSVCGDTDGGHTRWAGSRLGRSRMTCSRRVSGW